MHIPAVNTGRLLLRPWTAGDAGALLAILKEAGILRYFPNPTPPSLEKVERYLAHQLAHWQEHGYGHWAIVSRDHGGVLGWNGLEYLPEVSQTEVAYLLSRRAWGKGLATEAARAAIRFGFETAGLEKIIGLVHPDNTGSIRVLEKCGLTFSDRIPLWGLELCRYRIEKLADDEGLVLHDPRHNGR